MMCADVGAEAWLFFALTSALLFLFVIRSRQTQRWLRASRWRTGAFFWYPGLLDDRNVWLFRLLHGPLALVMWTVSLLGLYCHFHGPGLR